jgi:ribosome maturation factor RimP
VKREVIDLARSGENTATSVRRLLEKHINSMGYDVWDVEYVKEGTRWILRITIDSENGIDIDDCEAVHRAIDPILDEHDPIENAYYLEVSSPGLERDLRLDEHYLACRGQKVMIKLFRPLNGARQFVGVLDCNEDASVISVNDGSAEHKIERSLIAKANTVFDFE